jgi:hypothetical protein
MFRPPLDPSYQGRDWGPWNTEALDVALVGCSSLKQKTGGVEVMAKDLYRGRLCRMGYKYAVSMGWEVHFLSALHGLVQPCDLIAPYNFSIAHLRYSEHAIWGQHVVTALLALYPLTRLHLRFFVGRAYIRPILQSLSSHAGYWTWEEPLDGLDLFERFKWFEDQRQSGDEQTEARAQAHAERDLSTPRDDGRG